MVLEELGDPSYNICLIRSSSLIYFKSAAVNERSQNGLMLLTHLVTLTIVLVSEHACLILWPAVPQNIHLHWSGHLQCGYIAVSPLEFVSKVRF